MSELKPCPFCGGTPKSGGEALLFSIRCSECDAGLRLVADDAVERVTAAWNRRAYLAAAPAPEPVARKQFPVLSSGGQKIDYQLVADHGEQAKNNHYQTVERLSERGGLSWSELYAVLHNKPWAAIDTNEAILACRGLEAKYLAALATLQASKDEQHG